MAKKNNFTILGKSHNMISLLIDIIVEINHDNNEVLIVKNIPVYDKPEYKFTFSNSINYKSSIYSHSGNKMKAKF